MMMRAILAVTAVLLGCVIFGDRSAAADLGTGGGYVAHGDRCFLMRRSPILDLASTDKMEAEVERLYAHALEVSEKDSTIAGKSPRFAWSIEAKVACGKAIGYFKGREVNEEMVSKCDCFHGRMLSFMH